jgi:hypothetical protein
MIVCCPDMHSTFAVRRRSVNAEENAGRRAARVESVPLVAVIAEVRGIDVS